VPENYSGSAHHIDTRHHFKLRLIEQGLKSFFSRNTNRKSGALGNRHNGGLSAKINCRQGGGQCSKIEDRQRIRVPINRQSTAKRQVGNQEIWGNKVRNPFSWY